MKTSNGFTLIELIIVIVILGVLAVTAAPRFLDLSQDAQRAVFRATAAAFKEGVRHAHYLWLVQGDGKAVQDLIIISDPGVGGNLSVNEYGYPADTRGTSLTLNSKADCIDVWRAVLSSQDATVEGNDSAEYEASYNGNFDCTYTFVADPTLTVAYNSVSGSVDINL